MMKSLLPALVALLQLTSSAFTASIPSPFPLSVQQSSNSTMDMNACLAEGSDMTLTPSLNRLPRGPFRMIQNCNQRISVEFSMYNQPISMRDFCLACNLAIIETHLHLQAELMPAGSRIYRTAPNPQAFILFQPSNETTWGNLECIALALRRFMRRWEYVELVYEAQTVDGDVHTVGRGLVAGPRLPVAG